MTLSLPRQVVASIVLAWFVLWIGITFFAFHGMYRLWWDRERALYWGQSVEDQRALVFDRAGLPPGILNDISEIDRLWPERMHYRATGNPDALSYVTYLLAPRIPSGQGGLNSSSRAPPWSPRSLQTGYLCLFHIFSPWTIQRVSSALGGPWGLCWGWGCFSAEPQVL